MKAMAVTQFGKPLEWIDIEDPKPAEGEIVLSVAACAVCASDIKFMDGYYAKHRRFELPSVPGHEIVGTVTEVGDGVRGWQIGDRGVVYVYIACGICTHCRSGNDRLCRDLRHHIGQGVNGGFAEKIKIPARNLVGLSDKLSDEAAVVITDAVTTSQHAVVDQAQVKPGDRVIIIGAGGIGIHILQYVLLCGGYAILVDIDESKLAQGKGLGANETYCIEQIRDLPATVGFNKVIDSSGSLNDWQSIYRKIDAGGAIVLVGYKDGQALKIPVHEMILKELTVKASRGGSVANIYRAIEMVESSLIKPIISTVADLRDANEVIDKMRNNEFRSGRAVLVPNLNR